MILPPVNPATVAAARAAIRPMARRLATLAARIAPRVVPYIGDAEDAVVARLAKDPAAVRKLSGRSRAAIAAAVVAVALLDALVGSNTLGYFPADELFRRVAAVLDALAVGSLCR